MNGRALASALSLLGMLFAFALQASPVAAQVFGPRVDLDTGPLPRDVAVGDIDGDGHLDLVVTVQGAGLVSIFPGKGNRTFRPRLDIPVAAGPMGLALVDWTGDGHLDFLVGAASDSTLTVHVGDGTGAFSPGASVKCPTVPYEIEVADFGGDGRFDVAITSHEAGVALFHITGSPGGAFGIPQVLLTDPVARSRTVEVAQLDDIPGLDLYFSSAAGPSKLLKGNGVGGFLLPTTVTGSGPAGGMTLGDVDGDGRLDAVEVGVGEHAVLRLLRGFAGGAFLPAQTILTGPVPAVPRIADLNLDGRSDIAFVGSTGSQVSVSLQACAIQLPGSVNVDVRASDLALGDLDEDGDFDYVTANIEGASVSVRRNDGGEAICEAAGHLESNLLQFGTLVVGNILDRDIYLYSDGVAPLLVSSITEGSPDLTVQTEVPFAIQPGGQAPIVFRLQPSAPGAFSTIVQIRTNARPDSVFLLTITANVVTPPIVALDPESLAPVELPPGETASVPISIRNLASYWPLTGTATLTLDSTATDTAVPPVMGPAAQVRLDGEDHVWDVAPDGSITTGDPAAFAGGLDWTAFPALDSATVSDGGRTMQLGPASVNSRQFTRNIHVPLDEAWIRYVDTVHNPTSAPISYRIIVRSALHPALAPIARTSSGEGALQQDDDWAVVADESGPVIGHVLAGPGRQRPITANFGAGLQNVNYDYLLDLAPGASASILHFALQAPTLAAAMERAEALRHPDAAALQGLSAVERSRIVNFDLPQAIAMPAASFSIQPLGAHGLVIDFDAGAMDGERSVHASLRVMTDDPLRPLIVVPLELRVLGDLPDVVDVGPNGPGLALTARFVPNPMAGRGVRLAYALPTAGDARFELYDVRGRRIAARTLTAAPAGPGTLDWSAGTDLALAPGMYWTRLTQGGKVVLTKGVVLR